MKATALVPASPRVDVRALPLTPLHTDEYESCPRPPMPAPRSGLLGGSYPLLRAPPFGNQDGLPGTAQPLVNFYLLEETWPLPSEPHCLQDQDWPLRCTLRPLTPRLHAKLCEICLSPRSTVTSMTRTCILHCLIRGMVCLL